MWYKVYSKTYFEVKEYEIIMNNSLIFLKRFQVSSVRFPIDIPCSFYANYSLWENTKASAPTMRWGEFNWRAEAVVSVVIGSDTEKEKLMELIEFGSSTVKYWKISFLTQIFFTSNKVRNNSLIRQNCRRFAVTAIDATLSICIIWISKNLILKNQLCRLQNPIYDT